MQKQNKGIQKEPATTADDWLTAKELAPRIKKSASYVYSLVRRGSGIPFAEPSPRTILFHWPSVNKWLLDLQAKKRRANFED